MNKIKEILRYKPSGETVGRLALIYLGAILIFSGIGKLVIPPEIENIWFSIFLGFNTTTALIKILPVVEIIAGICLILRWPFKLTAWVTMFLILMFLGNNFWLIQEGKGFLSCGECLGWGIDMWPIVSLYVDIKMLGLLLLGSMKYQNSLKGVSYGLLNGKPENQSAIT